MHANWSSIVERPSIVVVTLTNKTIYKPFERFINHNSKGSVCVCVRHDVYQTLNTSSTESIGAVLQRAEATTKAVGF